MMPHSENHPSPDFINQQRPISWMRLTHPGDPEQKQFAIFRVHGICPELPDVY